MKIPEPRKLPSGSWNIRVQIDGQTISITKPTAKACQKEAMAIKSGAKEARKRNNQTVAGAIDDYITARENVLSPSTIRGYRAIARTRFQAAMRWDVGTTTQEKWQRAVNQEAKTCSAKTLKNAWGFLSSVIMEATGRKINVRLPQIVPNELPYLTAEEIPTFLSAIRGKSYEIAALLALSSLRRSEILALHWDDIDLENNCIYVHGAAVQNSDNKLVQRKENKNTSSRRTIPFILPQLRKAVEAADKSNPFVYPRSPSQLWHSINDLCKREGLPEVGVHGLRRSFASLAYHLGLSEEVTMRTGGWSDIYTMRKIYTKVSEKDLMDQGRVYERFFADLNASTDGGAKKDSLETEKLERKMEHN